MELIDKSALVAEIKRRIKEIDEIGTYLSPKGVLMNLLCHLNTIEVKESFADAFIEKTCEFLKSYRQDTPDGTGYIAGIINDKTIQDFINYMKGE